MTKFVLFCIGVLLLCIVGAQDIPPKPLEDDTTEAPTTTELYAETTTQPATTEDAMTTTTPTVQVPTTEAPIVTTFEPVTVPPTTTATAQQATPTVAAAPAPPSTTPGTNYNPSYPNYLNFQRCYYKVQRGRPYYKWICGKYRYVFPTECYYCCLYKPNAFAGCYRVHQSHCGYGGYGYTK